MYVIDIEDGIENCVVSWEDLMDKREDGQMIRPENPRQFFIQTPAFVDFLGLHPIAARLYDHYIRVCGDDGECYETVETTAWYCGCSVRAIHQRRKELAEVYNLLEILVPKKRRSDGALIPHIRVLNLWTLNSDFLGFLQTLQMEGIRWDLGVRMVLRDWLRYYLEAPREKAELKELFKVESPLNGGVSASRAVGVSASRAVGVSASHAEGVSARHAGGCLHDVQTNKIPYKTDPFIKQIAFGGGGHLCPSGKVDEENGNSSQIAREAAVAKVDERMERGIDEFVAMLFGAGGWNDWEAYKGGLNRYELEALFGWFFKALNRPEKYADLGVGFFKQMIDKSQRAGLNPDERERLDSYLETGNSAGLFKNGFKK